MHKLAVIAALISTAAPAYAQKHKYSRPQDVTVNVKLSERSKPKAGAAPKVDDRPVFDADLALSIEGLRGKFQAEQEQILRNLIKDTPDTDLDEKANYYFMLGELLAKQQRYWRLKATELEIKQAPKAEREAAAKKAKDFLVASVTTYKELTGDDRYRNYPKMDVALFYYAYTLQHGRYLGPARAAYDKLLENYPASKFVPEAHFAFADYFFEAGQLADAEARYRKVLEFPRSPVFWHATYKLGWIQLNQQKHQQALETFFEVAQGVRSDPKQEVLYRAARKDFVRAYAEVGKSDKAFVAFQRVDAKKAPDMLEILADLYFDQGKSVPAMATYAELMRRAPTSKQVCAWQYNIAQAALSLPRTSATLGEVTGQVVTEIEHLAKLHALLRGKKTLPPTEAAECRDNAAAMSGELARAYHSEFVKTKSVETLAYAERLYRVYLDVFPDAPDFPQTQYFHAELMWSRAETEKNPRLQTELWAQAANRFTEVVKLGKVTPAMKKEAAYAAVLGWKNALDVDPNLRKLAVATEDIEKAYDKVPQPRPIPEREQRMLGAFRMYIDYIKDPADDELVRMKFFEANTYRRYNQLDKATVRFEDILQNHPTHETAEIAANLLLDAYNRQQNFKAMLALVDRLSANKKFLDGKPELVEQLARLQIQGKRKEAEELERTARATKDFPKFVACGQAYMDIYNTNPEAKENDQVLYNALVCYHDGKSVSAAIIAYNTLSQFYPTSKLMPRAVGRIGKAYGDIAFFEKSAEKLEEYARKYAGEADAHSALNDAVVYRKGAGQDDKAIEDTKFFVRKFGNKNPTLAANALFSLTSVYEKQGNADAIIKNLRAYIAKFGATGGADRRVIAHAKIGLTLWKDSCPVKLVDGSCVELKRERAITKRTRGKELQRQCGPAELKLRVVKRDERKVREAHVAFTRAIAELEKVNGKTGGDEAGAKFFYGQTKLAIADRDFEAYLAMTFPTGLDFDPNKPALAKKSKERFDSWLKQKIGVGGKSTAQYEAVLGVQDAATSITAAARIGQIQQNLSDALFASEIPENVRTGAYAEDKIDAYCDQMSIQGTPLEERSLEAFRVCLDKSTELGWFSDWSKLCERELGQIRPDEFPTATELRGTPRVATVIAVEPPVYRLE
jgi:tetratricopeptide (TPR) repeat protein